MAVDSACLGQLHYFLLFSSIYWLLQENNDFISLAIPVDAEKRLIFTKPPNVKPSQRAPLKRKCCGE
jgi:hypothetical protein